MTAAQIWQPAYIGLGSNLSDPRAQVLVAFDRIGTIEGVRLVLRSRLYGSPPLGPADQPDYVNGVAGVLTLLAPRALLAELHAVERAAGRPAKRERWGPRILDLDLLVYGRERSSERELTLPHPGILERAFVLYPLADIAPDLDVPGMGRVAVLKQRLAAPSLRLLDADRASVDLHAPAGSETAGQAVPGQAAPAQAAPAQAASAQSTRTAHAARTARTA